MNCKKCNEEHEKESPYCPSCGEKMVSYFDIVKKHVLVRSVFNTLGIFDKHILSDLSDNGYKFEEKRLESSDVFNIEANRSVNLYTLHDAIAIHNELSSDETPKIFVPEEEIMYLIKCDEYFIGIAPRIGESP